MYFGLEHSVLRKYKSAFSPKTVLIGYFGFTFTKFCLP